tara:strand:- start:492 stop:809 length:318 start_codon:yes stop_codon:yes gene_type:complete
VAATLIFVGGGSGVDGGEQPPEALEQRPETMPERHLWAAALDLLIRDGQAYWHNASRRKDTAIELEQAFDDLMRCGPMTRHVCRWLDADPLAVSEAFVRWCEITP